MIELAVNMGWGLDLQRNEFYFRPQELFGVESCEDMKHSGNLIYISITQAK